MHDVNVNQMAAGLRALGAEASFKDLHHFVSDRFNTDPGPLSWSTQYCESVNDLREENRQTIARVNLFVQKVKAGQSREEALSAAWNEHPLLTR